MKKLILVAAMAISMALASCTATTSVNKVAIAKETYSKVHFYDYGRCDEINDWQLYEGGVLELDLKEYGKLDLKEYGKIIVHSEDVMLVKDKCPFCDWIDK